MKKGSFNNVADHLNLKGDPKVLKALVSNSAANDTILWSCSVTKINRKGKAQKRALAITNRHVLNLMPDNYSKCNRCIDLRAVHHLSTSRSAQEFVVHVSTEYDYRFKLEQGMHGPKQAQELLDEVVAVLRSACEAAKGAALEVTDMDVEALGRQVTTKAAVKILGRGSQVWSLGVGMGNSTRQLLNRANTTSGKPSIQDEAGGAAGGGAAGGGAAAAGGGAEGAEAQAEEADEGDDSAEEDELAEERMSQVEAAASVASGGPEQTPVGGAFSDTNKSKYNMDDFNLIRVLGKGAFGKVMLVTAKDTGKLYAMKSLSKAILAERGEVVHTKTERKTLVDTHHPFLVHLHFAFQSPAKLYLVMDYCNGGELFFHLKQTGRFGEGRAMLYAAEIASALEHLHDKKVIYRDLKPENVLLDCDGHIRITDFGLAKDAMELDDKTHTFCGTPDYLAPEVIKSAGHGRGVDWWSLGTMIYEMLGGLPPFYSENFNIMYDRILRAPLVFTPEECFNPTARSLLEGLLQKDPEKRLGSGESDGAELRAHAWFAPINWTKLLARELKPEFRPDVQGETDTSNFDEEFTSQPVTDSIVPESILEGAAKKPAPDFDGFTFVADSHLK